MKQHSSNFQCWPPCNPLIHLLWVVNMAAVEVILNKSDYAEPGETIIKLSDSNAFN